MTTDTSTQGDLYWDPFDVDIDTAPYDVWRRLRDEAPAYHNERHDFWALSRFVDVETAHRDPATYLSSHGTVLELMSAQPMASGQMINQDPPSHTVLRQMVSRAFTPRRVAQLEAHIRDLCHELLAPWDDGASFDYVEDFGGTLPSMVICELLGVPKDDRPEVKERIDTIFHIEPGVGMVNHTSLSAQIELHGYLLQLMEERGRAPGDDLLSGLTQTDLTLEQSADFAVLLVAAGTETVARLLGWTAVVLDENPDQRAAVAADLSLVPNTVEELLRFESPSPVQGRWSSRDVELHGTVIPKDSKVLLLTGSAGRDERQYPGADRFDVRRRFDQHVSFGYGIHFCLGASLARMEGRVALKETLRRHPDWEVDHANAVRLHTSTVRGWSSVPVS
jgi:cytochrome P450